VPRPFSGPRYQENERKCGGKQDPCAFCGKAVTSPDTLVEVLEGGGRFALKDEQTDEQDPGHMGFFPVGPTCAARLLKHGVKIVDNGKAGQ